MIILERVTKMLLGRGSPRKVLSSVSMRIPTNRRIALLGPSHEDNKAFINVLAGHTPPDSGRVIRKARVSFPAGELIGFDSDLTVRSNVAHVARLYGADVKSTVAFVERFAKLGAAFDRRYRHLAGAEKSELGHILTYSIPFDLYLLNRDATSPKNLQGPAFSLLEHRLANSAGIIVAIGQPAFARTHCELGLVLHNGQLMAFTDIEQALTVSHTLGKEEAAMP